MATRYLQVDIFDMEDKDEKDELNDLLRSKNVFEHEHHVGFTPMGGCKILFFYYIQDPKEHIPRENLVDDGNS